MGCKTEVVNCYAIGSISKTTNLTSNDNTVVKSTDAELYAIASTAFTQANGFSKYWQVKADGVYFGSICVVSAN